jgi:hypothetical protein
MIGTTNKMFALDHGMKYVTGGFGTLPDGSCGTNGGVCPAAAPTGNACDLVWCKYLADQNWTSKPYVYTAKDGSVLPNLTASCTRAGGSATYNGWGYTVSVSGLITGVPNGSGPPPPPTY